MAGGLSLVSSVQEPKKKKKRKSEPLKMEKNVSQYPKVGNKLQTITSEARHKQHNKLLEIFRSHFAEQNQTLECTVGRPLKELLHALKTEGSCQSRYRVAKRQHTPRDCFVFSAIEVGTTSDHSEHEHKYSK